MLTLIQPSYQSFFPLNHAKMKSDFLERPPYRNCASTNRPQRKTRVLSTRSTSAQLRLTIPLRLSSIFQSASVCHSQEFQLICFSLFHQHSPRFEYRVPSLTFCKSPITPHGIAHVQQSHGFAPSKRFLHRPTAQD